MLIASSHASAQLDEIVVTAQKREQSLNVKIEITPGNTSAAQISIRGGVTINPALTWKPTVGLYLNGSYIDKTQGSVFDVSDIERVEVLRGPQGKLYGRNTLAGAVKRPARVSY